MKAIRITLIVLLTVTGMSMLSAQPNSEAEVSTPTLGEARIDKLAQAEINYAEGLASSNIGLVESSLYYAVQLRLAFPEWTFSRLESSIDHLVKNGSTHCIRYKASLASTVFSSPRLIDGKRTRPITDMNAFFTSIAEQLEHKLLVSNE